MTNPSTTATPGLHYTAQYRERVMLRGGRLVTLRVLRAADSKKYFRSFERTSDRSRTLRYLKPRQQLDRAEVELLVTPQSEERLGIGVFERRLFGIDGGLIASAHLSRDPNDHERAEFVIGAIDEAQRDGLGKLLMRRLAEAAIERKIRYLTFTMLTRNDAARRLFASPPWNSTFVRHQETTTGEIDLRPEPQSSETNATDESTSTSGNRKTIREIIKRRKNRRSETS